MAIFKATAPILTNAAITPLINVLQDLSNAFGSPELRVYWIIAYATHIKETEKPIPIKAFAATANIELILEIPSTFSTLALPKVFSRSPNTD